MSILRNPDQSNFQLYTTFVEQTLPRHMSGNKGKKDDDEKPIPDPKDYHNVASAIEGGYQVCGAFLLKRALSPIDIIGQDNRLILSQAEPYMAIHMRPLVPEESNAGYVRESLAFAAQYLAENESDVNRLAGITYSRLGRTATALGFEVDALPVLPDQDNVPGTEPVIVHTSINDFISNY